MALADQWDVLLNGRGYMLDRGLQDAFGHKSLPMIRQQADTSERPGEQSLNPEGLWRRAQESWHHGAGQDWLDRDGSDPYRYFYSRGVDPWTKWGPTLLNDVLTPVDHGGFTNLYLATASGYIFMSRGQEVVNDSVAPITGLPAATVASLTSDGSRIYISYTSGGNGIWYNSAGAPFTGTQYVTSGNFSLLRYAKGRLMAASGASLYNITAAGAAPTALYTHPNASWTWTDMADGTGHIYAAGYAGDKSMIYRTAVVADGTTLDVPIVAGTLPDGEIARSVTGYLGYLIIGTDQGLRFAVADQNGDLTLGALIDIGRPVMCAEGQGRFVWFGWTDYDNSIEIPSNNATGLGRLDLSQFVDDLTPAYASDLMLNAYSGTGQVLSVATLDNKRYFTVVGQGLVMENVGTPVSTGILISSRITYGLPGDKQMVGIDLRHDPLPSTGGVGIDLYIDDDPYSFTAVGSTLDGATTTDPAPYLLATPLPGSHFQYDLRFGGGAVPRRVTLLADVTADRTEQIRVPILLADNLVDPSGRVARSVDVADEYDALLALFHDGTIFTYTEGTKTWTVKMADYQWQPSERAVKPGYWQGTFLAVLNTVG